MTYSDRVGRFSDGQQMLDDGEQHTRTGSFADGLATTQPERVVVGRFSTGQEILGDATPHGRVGSYADVDRPQSSIELHRLSGDVVQAGFDPRMERTKERG